jgi:hypothetical protein
MPAVGVDHPAQRVEAVEISSFGDGRPMVICGVCSSVSTEELMIDLPPWVWTAIQRAISVTFELIEPAAPTLVMSRNGMARTLPSCSA